MWSLIGQKVSYTTWTISGLQTLYFVNMVWMWPYSFNVGCTTSCENPTSSFCPITATIVSLKLKHTGQSLPRTGNSPSRTGMSPSAHR
ncbi:hypothetical protein Zmor_023915 [Zophobas morio]|uniref:Uncharacterized protein n=1 Tax=Zophobas morio TaxID=2755281 RepID=A0AA38HZD6_9CUCU|nr:hypothetical protein Zmor_023915 [Zophobas morio]